MKKLAIVDAPPAITIREEGPPGKRKYFSFQSPKGQCGGIFRASKAREAVNTTFPEGHSLRTTATEALADFLRGRDDAPERTMRSAVM